MQARVGHLLAEEVQRVKGEQLKSRTGKGEQYTYLLSKEVEEEASTAAGTCEAEGL